MTGFEIYLTSCAAVSLITFALTLRNLGLFHKPSQPASACDSLVSVCIPCRNEEHNVAEVISCVMHSRHRPIEILLYDDDSTDATSELISRFTALSPEVRAIPGQPLPPGWCGKQHACHRLAAEATGDWLLFIDADVRLEPDAIGNALAYALKADAALVSTFPRQITHTLGEKLIVPMMFYLLLGYLPFDRMRRSLSPAASAGCGQFILAQRDAYLATGGHESIKASMHDGIKLPRTFRRHGYKTDIFDGTQLASVRMYTGLRETWFGFAKNAYEGLGSLTLLVFLTVLHLAIHVTPWVLLPILILTDSSIIALTLCSSAIVLQVLQRLALTRRFGHSSMLALLHPLSVLLLTAVQWHSFALQLRSRQSWKGRTMSSDPAPANQSQERVVLVDADDREVGTSEKIAAHTNGGTLHRAFSVFILDRNDRLMLQQRADSKYHFAGLWTNTCCGHPRPQETPVEAARRRLQEEMGFTTQLTPRGQFTYKATDAASGLTEHEIDHVFVGRFEGAPTPNPDEASDWRWVDLRSLAMQLQTQPEKFTPWFPIALAELTEYQAAANSLPPLDRSAH